MKNACEFQASQTIANKFTIRHCLILLGRSRWKHNRGKGPLKRHLTYGSISLRSCHRGLRFGAQASSSSSSWRAGVINFRSFGGGRGLSSGVTKVVVLAHRCYQPLRPHTQAPSKFSTRPTVSTGEANDCILTHVCMIQKHSPNHASVRLT